MEYFWFIGTAVWIVSVLVCIALAQRKGYSAVLGALTGIVLSLIGVIVLGFMPTKKGYVPVSRENELPPPTAKEIAVLILKALVIGIFLFGVVILGVYLLMQF